MKQANRFVRMSDDSKFEESELLLAGRNHSMPLETLTMDVTPIDSHYKIIHFDVPFLETENWRLTIDGDVEQPLTLTIDDLRKFERVERHVTMECAGNGRTLALPRMVSQPWILGGVSTAAWAGVRLVDLLQSAGLTERSRHLVFTGADRGIGAGILHDYARSLSIEEAMSGDHLLAYEMNGQPLPPAHGFPLRLVCPGWYGMASVKWLTNIKAVEARSFLPQQDIYYLIKHTQEEDGAPVGKIFPRSLIAPPGVPDEARSRYAEVGSHLVQGRAWSGLGAIVNVEVSQDGGKRWYEAKLFPARNANAWHKFEFEWEAAPGRHRLMSRATDEQGNTQPLTANWNIHGLSNNMVSSVDVIVGEMYRL